MKKKSKKDILIRCIKTFFQGFLASLGVSLVNISSLDKTLVKSVLIGAIAGGLSCLMNYISNLVTTEEEITQEVIKMEEE